MRFLFILFVIVIVSCQQKIELKENLSDYLTYYSITAIDENGVTCRGLMLDVYTNWSKSVLYVNWRIYYQTATHAPSYLRMGNIVKYDFIDAGDFATNIIYKSIIYRIEELSANNFLSIITNPMEFYE